MKDEKIITINDLPKHSEWPSAINRSGLSDVFWD